MSLVLFYVKFCENQTYAEEFVAGRLYMNPLEYFKRCEHDVDDGRADRFEAAAGWWQPAALSTILIGNVVLSADELAEPLVVQEHHHDPLNVLCLYAGTTGDFERISADNVDRFREHLKIPVRCATMGSKAVLVHNVREFRDRVCGAVKRARFSLTMGPVHYFDPDTFSGHIQHAAFHKRLEYSWQREHRFVMNRRVTVAEAYTLRVGDLSDVCTIVDSTTAQPTVVLPDEEP
jgi:hypothetical protein